MRTIYLIIDSCIFGMVGDKNKADYKNRACRMFLEKLHNIIENTKHIYIVVNNAIKSDRNRHVTRYSSRWLKKIAGRRKLKVVEETNKKQINDVIAGLQLREKCIDAMRKDAFLICTALACDGSIISSDDTARNLFSCIISEMKTIGELCWINPLIEEESPLMWIENRCKCSVDRKLKTLSTNCDEYKNNGT